MATFIDRHPDLSIPRAVRRQMTEEARRSQVDPHGVRPVGHWLEDGSIYCVLEAPDGEAVVRHHADHSLECADLHEIPGLHGSRPVPIEDDQAVRAAIAHYWHTAGT
jgi:hypothetical protein